jgi:hypothetical protein
VSKRLPVALVPNLREGYNLLFRSSFLAVILASLLAIGVAACGSSADAPNQSASASSCVKYNKRFAKTKFLLHGGLAAGAFHQYIYKPLRKGAFKKGTQKRKGSFVKAGLAAAFVVHELKEARVDALSDEHLCKYATPLTTFDAKAGVLLAKLKGGKAGESDITDTNSALDALQKTSGLKDKKVVVPGAG